VVVLWCCCTSAIVVCGGVLWSCVLVMLWWCCGLLWSSCGVDMCCVGAVVVCCVGAVVRVLWSCSAVAVLGCACGVSHVVVLGGELLVLIC
jgi:hypothetical protein